MKSATSFSNFSWTAGGCNRRCRPNDSPSASPFFDLQCVREMRGAPGLCLTAVGDNGDCGTRRWMDAGERARGRGERGRVVKCEIYYGERIRLNGEVTLGVKDKVMECSL
jgi:hypothetical protein